MSPLPCVRPAPCGQVHHAAPPTRTQARRNTRTSETPRRRPPRTSHQHPARRAHPHPPPPPRPPPTPIANTPRQHQRKAPRHENRWHRHHQRQPRPRGRRRLSLQRHLPAGAPGLLRRVLDRHQCHRGRDRRRVVSASDVRHRRGLPPLFLASHLPHHRVSQFCIAFLAQSSAQRGILWWAANHRRHHKYSDTERTCTRRSCAASSTPISAGSSCRATTIPTTTRCAIWPASGAAVARPPPLVPAILLGVATWPSPAGPAWWSASAGARWCCGTRRSASTRSPTWSASGAMSPAINRATTGCWRC